MNETRLIDMRALRAQRRRLVAQVWQATSELMEFDRDHPDVKDSVPEIFEGVNYG